MPQRIIRFSVGQTAKVLGIVYTVVGIVFVPFFVMAAKFGSANPNAPAVRVAFFLPFLYGLLGLVVTAIACAVYNLVASWVGGIEVELGDAGPSAGRTSP